MFTLIIDDRERQVIPFVYEMDEKASVLVYKVERLAAGDYCVMLNDCVIALFERKSWTDLLQSMTDGRKENINNLLGAREKTQCKLFYIIEGSPITEQERLQSHLDHIMYRDNIHIVYTQSPRDTIRRIYQLIQNISTLDWPAAAIETNNRNVVFEKLPPQTKDIVQSMWLSINNVGPSIVDAMMKCMTLHDFFAAEMIDISAIRYPCGRRINEKTFDSIRKQKNVKIKCLEQIPGITKARARQLLDEFSFDQLAAGDISGLMIGKRKLGKVLSARVNECLSFKLSN